MNNVNLLDGKKVSEEILSGLKEKIIRGNIKAQLYAILVGNNLASEIYVKNKEKKCNEVGIKFKVLRFNDNINENTLIDAIKKLNNDKKITGILVQLPLPNNLNTSAIINSIKTEKDVDCLADINRKNLENNNEKLAPCTPKGIIRLLDMYDINLKNKKIVIVGLGHLVGKPLSIMLKNRKLNFTAYDDATLNLKKKTIEADILISATGVPGLIKKDYIKKGAIIVDAGATKIDNKIVGDVDFDDVKDKISYITPVPGGVGPMTIAMLMENIIEAYYIQKLN